ncbi:hypothetical protein G7085_15370 [Tessaracoccus sp. HDW20]|uniref:hypothetical protein n=1 Tax=Tessaracoccus coleopterorum TaxID=2714950 RepID=UPI0018D28BDD|nr:hypothetical protein [Tessaracoccus coleopterorum]NHB85521.1 hypothetical protein [Tessaracoccus coleopterorum]
MSENQGGNGRLTLVIILVIGLLFSGVVLFSVYSLKGKAEQVEGSAPSRWRRRGERLHLDLPAGHGARLPAAGP